MANLQQTFPLFLEVIGQFRRFLTFDPIDMWLTIRGYSEQIDLSKGKTLLIVF